MVWREKKGLDAKEELALESIKREADEQIRGEEIKIKRSKAFLKKFKALRAIKLSRVRKWFADYKKRRDLKKIDVNKV